MNRIPHLERLEQPSANVPEWTNSLSSDFATLHATLQEF
jgi:hypothetical protein